MSISVFLTPASAPDLIRHHHRPDEAGDGGKVARGKPRGGRKPQGAGPNRMSHPAKPGLQARMAAVKLLAAVVESSPDAIAAKVVSEIKAAAPKGSVEKVVHDAWTSFNNWLDG